MLQSDIDSLPDGPLEGALKQLDIRRIRALENRVMVRVFLCIIGAIFIIPFSFIAFK